MNYQSFNDIIVGWRVERFGQLNGSWKIIENPILKHEISLNFFRWLISGFSYDIEIFFMKEPEINDL